MLYLTLIIAPAIVGLILGFTLPSIIVAALHRDNPRQNEIKKEERRLICIR